MKKYIEIIEEIKRTGDAIQAAEIRKNELVESYMKICDIRKRYEAKKAIESEVNENTKHKTDLRITMKILKNNAKVALFNEVLPLALEVLKKYNGKPYGEKTKEKISNEVKAATNCRFYISSRYGSQSFEVYPANTFGNDYNISCGTKYTDGNKKQLLIDNKIQPVIFDEIELYYVSPDYVEDIPHRVEELKALYAEAVAKQKELATICSEYNSLAVGDIQSIYKDKSISEYMMI